MTPVARGKYCAACSKTVTDFSLLSDGAILDILRQASTAGACGRFSSGQLDRVLVDARYRPSFTKQLMKKAAAILLLFQSMATASVAQQVRANKKTEQRAKDKKPEPAIRQIRGKVLDYGITPVAGIKVRMSGSTTADTVTDSQGEFVFNLPAGFHDSSVKLQAVPVTDTAVIDNVTISAADIAKGKEVRLYRYRGERLPEFKMVCEIPLVETFTQGGFITRDNRDERGINTNEVKTPRTHPNRSFWQSIVQPFKRKKHVTD